MSFIAPPQKHTQIDECVFGQKLYAQARAIRHHRGKRVKLIKDSKCRIEEESEEEKITRWKRKLELRDLRPYYEIGHYLRGHHLLAVNCNPGDSHPVSGATGQHGAKCCYLYACENPATCFVDIPIRGMRGGLNKILYVKSIADTIIKTGDLPEKIEKR